MPQQIHQILPFFGYGSAIGNLALDLRSVLREWGYGSEIFAEHWDSRLKHECRPYRAYLRRSHPDNLLILHYSVGGQVNQFAQSLPDRLVLYYHNITPPHFHYAVNGDLASRLQQARRALPDFAGRGAAIADSPYNRQELEDVGFRVLGVVPPLLTSDHLRASADTSASLPIKGPGETHWLHVGRFAPNKCIHDIIKAFYYLHNWIAPTSRLWLVGSMEGMQEYVDALRRLAKRLSLEDSVVFVGPVDSVRRFYEIADLYITLSEHEGFCIPVVEAMRADVPVLAFGSTGVPSTLGDAGVLIRHKGYPHIAELAHEMVTNMSLRAQLLAKQRERAAVFSPDRVRGELRKCLDQASHLRLVQPQIEDPDGPKVQTDRRSRAL